METLSEILSVMLDAAPWLMLGFLLAGVVKGLVSESLLQRLMGGDGLKATARAAMIGMPLPLCSCGAIPTAFSLRRSGAGKGPTTAFLVGTPGVGVDSVVLTYALLGPVMMLGRVLGTLVTAIVTGLLVGRSPESVAATPQSDHCGGCCGETETPMEPETLSGRLAGGIRYAFTDLLDDMSAWLVAGLLLAGVLVTLFPPGALANLGAGFAPMLLMALIGIPLYLCATAATPIAAAMLLTGVAPGTVLVLLIAGPVTSMATLGVFRREMGSAALGLYLLGIVVVSLMMGGLMNLAVEAMGLNIVAQASAAGELLPSWLKWLSLGLLAILVLKPLRHRLWLWGGRLSGA
ncbi:MAG: SO_0444 family Cu/Zn efflux transporter [Oleiphilaceae bacterium]|nr:SO_0444 family Cu/Zn efflux transporter [Oleiphilaceae bacterium]